MTHNNEILIKALDAFKKETGIEAEPGHPDRPDNLLATDTAIKIRFGGRTAEYLAEIRPAVTGGNVGFVAQDLRGRIENWILVTKYVHPEQAKILRQFKVQFIDTAGNMYIDDPPALFFIQGNKLAKPVRIGRDEDMFGNAGIRVLFALLCKQELLNAPFRKVNEEAMVALGTVAGVIRDLLRQGYLIEQLNEPRRLIRRKELLEKWLNAYANKLRPKTLLGIYKAEKPDFWHQAEINPFDDQWGGEVAAFRLTRYMKPQILTIYTRRPVQNLVFDLKLRQDKNGDIELREKFWNFEYTEQGKTLVPPLLIYADLMATGDPRNIETAHTVYNDYLQRFIEQD